LVALGVAFLSQSTLQALREGEQIFLVSIHIGSPPSCGREQQKMLGRFRILFIAHSAPSGFFVSLILPAYFGSQHAVGSSVLYEAFAGNLKRRRLSVNGI
jgi:hypothetical protein